MYKRQLPGAAAQGLIWGIMAIGVYLTFRVLDIADLTVDGTMCTGGAVCVMMMTSGHNVWVSLLVATLAGMTAGLVTGIFHTFMGIPAILAGILTQMCIRDRHEALDAATQGFEDAVKEGLGEENVTFDEQNAQGDSAT